MGANVAFTVTNNIFAVAKVTALHLAVTLACLPSIFSQESASATEKNPDESIAVIHSVILKHRWETTHSVFGDVFRRESFRVNSLSFAACSSFADHKQKQNSMLRVRFPSPEEM